MIVQDGKTKELNRSLFEVRKYACSRDAQTLLNMMNHFVNNFDSKYGLVNHKRKGSIVSAFKTEVKDLIFS